MGYLRAQGKPKFCVMADGQDVSGDIDSRARAIELGDYQARLGKKVEVLASYDGFVTFWTAASMSPKGVDSLM